MRSGWSAKRATSSPTTPIDAEVSWVKLLAMLAGRKLAAIDARISRSWNSGLS
jgi:hypothetical protein